MAIADTLLFGFNRGLVSRLALARTDLKRTALSAEQQTNWMPRSLGSMMLRPGWGYIGSTLSNAFARHIPFVKSFTDTAIVELTDSIMRVRVSEAIVTRPSVSSAIVNGTFDTNLATWTDADEAGAVSAWAAPGLMSLIGTHFNAAIRKQTVTVAGGNVGVEHGLHIVIYRGPVTLRVGSSDGADDYIAQTDLDTGTHSLALTPSGNFFIALSNTRQAASFVDSIAIEAAGALTLPTPWPLSILNDSNSHCLIRHDQSGDVIFVAVDGYQQRKIERRATRSWSIVLYAPEDGPFRTANLGPILLTPSGTTGDITLTASAPLFHLGQIGALFRIASLGQSVSSSFTGEAQFSSHVKVVGIGGARQLSINVSNVFVGTVQLQRSVSAPGAWTDVTGELWTAPAVVVYADGLDNQIIYYRLGITTGHYTSGQADVVLSLPSGSLTGICRLTSFGSATSVNAAVLTDLGGTGASSDWSEGEWSDYRGWPTSVRFYDGRLGWFGRDREWLSVSDAFSSFDDTIEGDSGPISRSIGSGPVDVINWALGLQQLVVGGQGAEISIRSTSFGEPLTPTNFNQKPGSTQGSAAVDAVQVDTEGFFVQKSGRRIFKLAFDFYTNVYTSSDITIIDPDLGISSSFVLLRAQRQPDTRIHALRADGSVAVLVYDNAESLQCWIETSSTGSAAGGFIEDMLVMPAQIEDAVYYTVRRTINGQTVRYFEKWAREDECQGSPGCKLADAHIVYSGAAVTTITGLSALEGCQVVVWGWNTATPFTVTLPDGSSKTVGRDFGTFTVASGQITGLSAAVTDAVVGLFYDARFKSAKLAYAAQLGTALTQRKKVTHAGFVLADTHASGLQYGPDFDNLDDMPGVEEGADVDADTVWTAYDQDAAAFAGTWKTDSRICLYAAAPKPCTVLAVVVGIVTNERP